MKKVGPRRVVTRLYVSPTQRRSYRLAQQSDRGRATVGEGSRQDLIIWSELCAIKFGLVLGAISRDSIQICILGWQERSYLGLKDNKRRTKREGGVTCGVIPMGEFWSDLIFDGLIVRI